MAQRFNAPPGWNVPPDFVPTSDWQPDPSWPPAPEGWNYWVDDAAQPASGFGASSTPPAYGTPSSPAYGSAEQNTYVSAPAGAYGSTAPGSANATIAQGQIAGGKRNLWIGIGLVAAFILITVVTYAAAPPGGRFYMPWYFGLVGVILAIRGLIEMNKGKKAEAASLGYGQGSVPPGVTPPGTTPPGQNPPGF